MAPRDHERTIMKLLITAFALAVPTAASAMPTAEFVERWNNASNAIAQAAEQSGGQMTAEQAMTPEVRQLIEEFSAIGDSYRREIMDARAAGDIPRACPPKEVDLTINVVVAEAAALGPEWQSREFGESFAAVMDMRYPCAGSSSGT